MKEPLSMRRAGRFRKKTAVFLYCFRFPLSLCLNWFRMNVSVIRIKRESGANPGQSRCCEALLKS